jgi:hypothetical protein
LTVYLHSKAIQTFSQREWNILKIFFIYVSLKWNQECVWIRIFHKNDLDSATNDNWTKLRIYWDKPELTFSSHLTQVTYSQLL